MKRIEKKLKIKRKPGRKTLFKDNTTELAYKLCAILGAKDKDLAAFFGVDDTTIEYWKRHKKEFKEALSKGKLIADANVAKAYYKRAIGYSHPDIHIMANRVNEYDKEGNIIKSYNQPLLIPITKYYPPDSFACLKWLTTRQRENWADVAEVHHKHSGEINFRNLEDIPIEDFTEQEQEFLFKIGMKQLTNGTLNN
jgi:hypothetical protein